MRLGSVWRWRETSRGLGQNIFLEGKSIHIYSHTDIPVILHTVVKKFKKYL